jgi:maltodextrin utilization protein YvdJ
MKNTIIIGAMAFMLFSCAKDRKCTCTTSSDAVGNVAYTSTTTLVEVTKGQAKAQCVSKKWTTTNGVNYTEDCKLD